MNYLQIKDKFITSSVLNLSWLIQNKLESTWLTKKIVNPV